MRPLKFRAWDTKLNRFRWFDLLTASQYVSQPHMKEPQQFTGLTDRNGKEIWEGDIFSLGTERYKVNNRSGCFMADNIRNGHSLTHSREDVRVWHTLMESSMLIEVLGNIYEQPNLMDEKVIR